jgi:trans-aconitate 2-methyltransferase
MTNTHWNAEVYERIARPMRRWAQRVIEDLELRGDEVVLDAGCGSGAVTLDLLARLPTGRIHAVDSSAEMIASLSRQLAKRGITRVQPLRASLTDFSLPEPVDCVFSNAVFHWIPDDAALFGNLQRVARPGARLRAQCGGFGNLAGVLAAVERVRTQAPFARHLEGFLDAKLYRNAERAQAALEAAGWRQVRARLWPESVPFEDPAEAALYAQTILLRDHVARMPAELGAGYARAVVDAVIRTGGTPFRADYVRLDLWAIR